MEVVAKLLDVRLADIGRLSFEVKDGPAAISSTCTVFAKSEILALLRRGTAKGDILAGACQALVNRVASLLARVGMAEDFVISGGIAKNSGVGPPEVTLLLGDGTSLSTQSFRFLKPSLL